MTHPGQQNYEASREIILERLRPEVRELQDLYDRMLLEPDWPRIEHGQYRGLVDGAPCVRTVNHYDYSANRGIRIGWRDGDGVWGTSSVPEFLAFLGRPIPPEAGGVAG